MHAKNVFLQKICAKISQEKNSLVLTNAIMSSLLCLKPFSAFFTFRGFLFYNRAWTEPPTSSARFLQLFSRSCDCCAQFWTWIFHSSESLLALVSIIRLSKKWILPFKTEFQAEVKAKSIFILKKYEKNITTLLPPCILPTVEKF